MEKWDPAKSVSVSRGSSTWAHGTIAFLQTAGNLEDQLRFVNVLSGSPEGPSILVTS